MRGWEQPLGQFPFLISKIKLGPKVRSSFSPWDQENGQMLLNLKSTSLREVRKEPRRQRAVRPQVWKRRSFNSPSGNCSSPWLLLLQKLRKGKKLGKN